MKREWTQSELDQARLDIQKLRSSRGLYLGGPVMDMIAQRNLLRDALKRIHDGAGSNPGYTPCGCEDHNSPDCCNNADYCCPECISGAALESCQ
jgi:hypothetical protein